MSENKKPNHVPTIAKNVSILLIAYAVNYILSLFSTILAARYLGVGGYGVLAFAIAYTGIFAVFGDMGFQTLIVREVARDWSLAGKYLANVSLIRIILAALMYILIVVCVNIMGYPVETRNVVYIMGASVIFMVFTTMLNSVFQAFEHVEHIAIGQILNGILTLGGIWVASGMNLGISSLALVYMISNLSNFIYCTGVLIFKFRDINLKKGIFEYDRDFWKWGLKQALPFGLTALFGTVYYYMDSVILSIMKGNETVGWYSVAYKLALLPLVIPAVLNTVIFPIMARFSVTSHDSLLIIFRRYLRYMVLLGIPMGIGTILLADKFIFLIYGSEFMPAISALQILIWSTVFIFMNGVFGRLIESLNRQQLGMKLAFWAAVLNIVLNLLLIPYFSYMAASYNTVVTEFFVLVVWYIICARLGYRIALKEMSTDLVKTLLAGLIMGIFIWYFKNINLFAVVFLSVIVYFTCIVALRFFDENDMNFVKEVTSYIRGKFIP